jgi:hypothetical protein
MTKRKENLWLLFKFLRNFLFVIFLFMFFIMMRDVWSKFVSKMTSTGVTFRRTEKDDKKFLPSFTFCPWPVYKSKGLHYNPDNFKKNTFNLEEIFYDYTLDDLNNSSLYSVNETWSIQYGRCYTINYKVNYISNLKYCLNFFQV